MNVTLIDIFNYIIKKYKLYISLIICGIALSTIYFINYTGKSKTIFSINAEYLFWEQRVMFNEQEKFQNYLRVNSRFEGIVESAKLNIVHEYIPDQEKAKILLDDIQCSKDSSLKILTCTTVTPFENVEDLISFNSEIILKIFTDEINNAKEATALNKYYLENKPIIEKQISKLTNFYEDNKDKIVIFSTQKLKPRYSFLIFLTLAPFLISIGFLIMINPEIFLNSKNTK